MHCAKKKKSKKKSRFHSSSSTRKLHPNPRMQCSLWCVLTAREHTHVLPPKFIPVSPMSTFPMIYNKNCVGVFPSTYFGLPSLIVVHRDLMFLDRLRSRHCARIPSHLVSRPRTFASKLPKTGFTSFASKMETWSFVKIHPKSGGPLSYAAVDIIRVPRERNFKLNIVLFRV